MSKMFRKKTTINILAFVLVGALILTIPSLVTVAQAADGSSIGASGEGANNPAIGESNGAPDLTIGVSDGAEYPAIGMSDGAQALPIGFSASITPFTLYPTVTTFAQLEAIVNGAVDDYVITVADSFSFPHALVIPNGMTILLLGDISRTLTATNSRHFVVEGGLVISNTITLDGGGSWGGIEVWSGGEFTLSGATIKNCRADRGAGVDVQNGAVFTFDGGTISNCIAIYYGGGIACANLADFTMVDGTIEGCEAFAGGGIAFASSTNFTMSQGTIKGCKAHYGGGIFIQNSSKSNVFNLAGNAEIIDCEANHAPSMAATDYPHGAGVYIGQGTFQMTGNSKITNCVSERHGGGINGTSDSVIVIGSGSDSPEISGCVANEKLNFTSGTTGDGQGNGGGIFSEGNVIINSGSIKDCHAVNNGGGIFMDSSGSAVLNMYGGTIDSCTAGNAGGVSVGLNEFNMYGGSIVECDAAYLGGGVHVYDGKFSMTGSSSASPVIDNCSAGSTLVDWWAGKGGGVYVDGSGQITMNGATIQNCNAYVNNGDMMRSYASGGGIYLEKDATGSIDDSTISGCTAMYHGGGIFTKNYNNLTTTPNVLFSNNLANSASSFRIPADDIVDGTSGYPCTSAGSISPALSDLRWRNSPLNNFDINYLSYSVIYKGNGGTDGSATEFEVFYEYAPFTNNDSAAGIDVIYTILANDNNGVFEFTNAAWQFGMWSNLTQHIPIQSNFEEYGPATSNPTYTFNSYYLMYTQSPYMTFYALWQKDLIVKKEVIGAYGDLTKEFKISVTTRNAWWDDEQNYTFDLSHGETAQPITIYNDYFITVEEDPGSIGNYTVEYYDGTSTYPSSFFVQLQGNHQYDTDPAITITVQNSLLSPVPTLVSSGNEAGLIAVIGLLGLLGRLAVSCYRRKKRG